jgi:hypothetical protein
MTLRALTFLHVVFALIAIASGPIVLGGLLTQELLQKWAVRFLRFSLAASVIGLLFPFDQPLPTHWASMLSVYLAGAAILAWRKFHLAGVWSSIFAMSISFVLSLDVLAVMLQVFKHIPLLMTLASTRSGLSFMIIELAVMMPFVIYGIVAAKRFHYEPPHSFLMIKGASRSGDIVRPNPPNAHKNNKPDRSNSGEVQIRGAVHQVTGQAVKHEKHRRY